jgi:hypothetical protein
MWPEKENLPFFQTVLSRIYDPVLLKYSKNTLMLSWPLISPFNVKVLPEDLTWAKEGMKNKRMRKNSKLLIWLFLHIDE